MLTIHVARSERQFGTTPINFPGTSLGVLLSDVTLIGITRRQDLDQLPTDLYDQIDGTTRALSRLMVLRAHPEEAHALTFRDSQHAARLGKRFPSAAIFVLHAHQDNYVLTKIAGREDVTIPDEPGLIHLLRQAELRAIAEKPAALLPESTNYHYIGPSGKHYKSFLRVGTAVQSAADLDAVCFWVLPFLKSRTVVVLDSPTLISLGLGLSQYARDQTGSDSKSVHAVEILEDPSAESRAALAKRLHRIMDLAGSKLPVLCLSSVLSSGRTLEAMISASEDSAAELILLGLFKADEVEARAGVPFLAAAPSQMMTGDPCPYCEPDSRERSARITIDPVSLHVNVGGAVVARRITQASARPAKEFLDRYSGFGAVRVHCTESDGHLRHHAINIDVVALLEAPAFRARLNEKLLSLRGVVDAVLAPSHAAAGRLAEIAHEVLGLRPIVADEDKLDLLPPREKAELLGSNSLLILDDVVISGDRIRGYRSYLFELGRLSGDVHVLVGLSRPTSQNHFEAILNLADQMSADERSFHDVERVLLPNWGQEECPWCIELRLIDNYAGWGEDFELSERMIQRAEYLGARSDPLSYERPASEYPGLEEEIFWTPDGTRMPLGANSIFAPEKATEAELFFAVASSIQTLRSMGHLDEEHRPPIAKVLTPEFWAQGRFYAPSITASILRAAKPHDLLPPQPSRALIRSVEGRLSSADSHALVWELLMAIGERKLPPPSVTSPFEAIGHDPAVLDLLGEQIDGAWSSSVASEWASIA